MKNHHPVIRSQWCIIAILSAIVLYTSAYFTVSTIFVGRVGGDVIRIRLFDHAWQITLWKPIEWVEQSMRQGEFDVQVRDHASLPPPA